MADLISREAAIKLLRGKCVAKYPSTFMFGLFAAADEIEKLPTVDAVEVVRCKDCVTHGNCLTEDTYRIARIENPYCCGGKRREENERKAD